MSQHSEATSFQLKALTTAGRWPGVPDDLQKGTKPDSNTNIRIAIVSRKISIHRTEESAGLSFKMVAPMHVSLVKCHANTPYLTTARI